MRLDHVSYATSPEHLADVVQRIGALLGAPLTDGGLHPRFGTRNFVLALAEGKYLEVVAALDHPAADQAPFGQAVRQRAELGGGWLGWVVAVDDLAPVEQRLGRAGVDGNRHRPDGFDLRWRQVGVKGLIADPQLPFFIQWLTDVEHHPSAGASGEIAIDRLDLCGDEDALELWLGGPTSSVVDGQRIEWVDDEEPGLVAVHFSTPHGVVRID